MPRHPPGQSQELRPGRAARGRVAAARALVAGLALVAILAQLVDLAAHGALRPATFFSYFTIQSALLGSGVLLVGAARWRTVRSLAFDLVRGGAVVYLLVTGIVFAVLLAGTDVDTALPWANVMLHQVLPVAMLLDWLLVPPAQRLTGRHGLLWLSYPLAWAGYTLSRGALVGQYPYPFLNPATAGAGRVAASGVAILIGMLLLAEAVVLVGNAARARWSRRPPTR